MAGTEHLTPEEVTQLVTWVKKIHGKERQAIMLIDGYDMPEVSKQLRAFFPDHLDAGPVDFAVYYGDETRWVSLRPVLQVVPTRFLSDPTVGVCTVRKPT